MKPVKKIVFALSVTLFLTAASWSIFRQQNATLENPILFSLVVSPMFTNGTFGHQLETFGNHLTHMRAAPRGGDLCLMDVNGNVRFLTKEAGYGVGSGEIQAENAIAVRQPYVHYTGTKALFSMVIGGPTKAYDQSYRSNRWQIYEITNLDEVVMGIGPKIVKVSGQPDYNNVSPIYGSDDKIIYTSDAPLFDMTNTYPQLDEYESSETNTGIFKLDPATGDVIHLTHSPSGDFDLHLAQDGRVISTRWEHLKRDQQADAHREGSVLYTPVNYESEMEGAAVVNAPAMVDGKPFADADGTPYELFPEAFVAHDPTRDPNEPLHDFNEFLPWEITENGERHQTMNHVGRHEFGGVYQNGSKMDDPNLVYLLGDHSANQYRESVSSDAGIFQIKEDPRPGMAGTFYGAWSREFGRFSSGRIFQFSLPIGANPQDMEITDWTSELIDSGQDNDFGHFRNPVMLMNGKMLVSHATESGLFDMNHPYTFRLAIMMKVAGDGTRHEPSAYLTEGFSREIVYWGDSTDPISATVDLSETGPMEIVARDVPMSRPKYEIADIEKEVLNEEGIDEAALRAWMVENNLALIAIRNATERDEGERQQPFNLRVPGGVASIPAEGKVYDISHFQIFQADLIRSYGLWNYNGRRPLATPIHDNQQTSAISTHNLLASDGPQGSVKIGMDGSIAAFVPATRALTWQTVAPDGESVVRERQWLTFAPGEIRTCAGCHGINDKSHLGNEAPQNKPEALRQLMRFWKGDVINNVKEKPLVEGSVVLYQNFPNPFTASTTIRFDLAQSENVSLEVYDLQGKKLKTIASGRFEPGEHVVSWDLSTDFGTKATKGMLFYSINLGQNRITKRMIVK